MASGRSWRSGGFWRIALAALLVWWGLMLLSVLDFSSADEILAIGALATAALIFLNR